MEKLPLRLGIVGCGDFLRWQEPSLLASRQCVVSAVYDPDRARAQKWAEKFGAISHSDSDSLAGDPEVDIVVAFVPPWVRPGLLEEVANFEKPVLTTKPLAPTTEACERILSVMGEVPCGVLYNRTENAEIETLKAILEGGEFGRLSLYKQDWIHHFPQWNDWATDPDRNGGPFMDAMVHNLNIARYLMGRPIVGRTFFSDNHAQNLRCRDTEFMKLDFEGGGSAHLFITWAADLAVFGTEGNDREHIENLFMVTDMGWHISKATSQGRAPVGGDPNAGGWLFRKDGKEYTFPPTPCPNIYDAFAAAVFGVAPWPSSLPTLQEAAEDIRLIRGSQS